MAKMKRILVVDDEEVMYTIIKAELESLGCSIEYAANGRIGLEAIEREKPDLVITDLIMLEMTGMEMLRCLFERQINIPTILMTGFGNIKTLKEAYSLGVYDFVEKPLKLDELKAIAQKAISQLEPAKNQKNMREEGGAFRFLSLHVEEELFQKVEADCKAKGTSISTLIKGLLKEHFRVA